MLNQTDYRVLRNNLLNSFRPLLNQFSVSIA
nr:MAG TPA: hypothetical protein [Caudoviricetes sp.]